MSIPDAFQYTGEKNVYISLGSYTDESMGGSWSGPFGEAQACPPSTLEMAKSAPSKIIAIDPKFTQRIEFIDSSNTCFERVEENVYRHTSLNLEAYIYPTMVVLDSSEEFLEDLRSDPSLAARASDNLELYAKALHAMALLKYPTAIKIERVRDYIFTVIKAGGSVCIGEFTHFPMLIKSIFNQLRKTFSEEERSRFTLITHLFHSTTVQTESDEMRSTNALAILYWKNSDYFEDVYRIESSKQYDRFTSLHESLSAILSSSDDDETKYQLICSKCEEENTTFDEHIAKLFPQGIPEDFREYIEDSSSQWPAKLALRETIALRQIDFTEEHEPSKEGLFFQRLLRLYFLKHRR